MRLFPWIMAGTLVLGTVAPSYAQSPYRSYRPAPYSPLAAGNRTIRPRNIRRPCRRRIRADCGFMAIKGKAASVNFPMAVGSRVTIPANTITGKSAARRPLSISSTPTAMLSCESPMASCTATVWATIIGVAATPASGNSHAEANGRRQPAGGNFTSRLTPAVRRYDDVPCSRRFIARAVTKVVTATVASTSRSAG